MRRNDYEPNNRFSLGRLCAAVGIVCGIDLYLAKIGINGVDSNLATAIRTVVVLVMAWGLVFMTGVQKQISNIGARSWLFLVLSGIATGLSWLFYYRALQMGDASRVVPIDKSSVVISMVLAFVVLKEQLTWQSIVGVC